MLVKDVKTGEEFEAIIEPVTSKDFKTIAKDSKRFDKFDWDEFKTKEVYKLRVIHNDTILGLMSITDHTDPGINAIEIGLLEVSAENIGENKGIDHIGGCLIAFACRESIKRGHDGYVFLVPKTGLIEHYAKKYGFQHFPLRTAKRPEGIMTVYDGRSRALIKKYIE